MRGTKHDRENKKWAEECEYLARLLETDGNASVPRDSIIPYFRVQAVGATRDRFFCLADTLRRICDGETLKPDAIVSLRAHAAALEA